MDKNRSFPGWTGPAVGLLVGAIGAVYEYFWGTGGHRTFAALLYMALPAAAGCVVWLIDWMEHKPGASAQPSATATKVILGLVPFVFWIPVLGVIFVSWGLYRTRWLPVPEWFAFLLCCMFYVAVAITFVAAVVFAMDFAGMR
jgi:hypothetical protein